MVKMYQSEFKSIFLAIRGLESLMDLTEEKIKTFQRSEKVGNFKLLEQYLGFDRGGREGFIGENLKVVHEFLKYLYFHEKERLKDLRVQNGIRALMIICSEAVHNLDKLSDIWQFETQSLKQLKEYQELIEFYQKKLVKRLSQTLEHEELWRSEWGEVVEEEQSLEIIEDIASVSKDEDYELFYLRDENGRRFFSYELLRHLKLLGDAYKVSISDQVQDPFGAFKVLRDKNSRLSSKAVTESLKNDLKKFLKFNEHFQNKEFCSYFSNCVYALYLASVPSNEFSNGGIKTCFEYYSDAWNYLSKALNSPDYLQLESEKQSTQDKNILELLSFVNKLCYHLFLKVDQKDVMMGFLYKMLKKDSLDHDEYVGINSNHLWNSLLDERNFMSEVLLKLPSSPVFHMVDSLYFNGGHKMFDPLLQQSHPSLLYQVHNEIFKTTVVKMPGPTHQIKIDEVEVSKLFEGFFRAVKSKNKDTNYLLFNLQDRTGWKEHTRAKFIETLPEKKAFKDHLLVCTIPCDTAFYHQSEDYEQIHDAVDFKKMFLEQVESEKDCGFCYSEILSSSKAKTFSKKSIEIIHEHFFGSKEILSQKNRQDFIQIFYLFFILKIMDTAKATHMSFSCKDAVDLGPAFSASLFSLVKILGFDDTWGKEEEDFLSYLLFSPALITRQRAIKLHVCERALSALSTINADKDINKTKLTKAFEDLFGYKIFKSLCAQEIKD